MTGVSFLGRICVASKRVCHNDYISIIKRVSADDAALRDVTRGSAKFSPPILFSDARQVIMRRASCCLLVAWLRILESKKRWRDDGTKWFPRWEVVIESLATPIPCLHEKWGSSPRSHSPPLSGRMARWYANRSHTKTPSCRAPSLCLGVC